MQYMENYTDRQAAEAMTTRIDWKYVLSLELTDPGFDFSVLSEFRQRLLVSGQQEQILSTLLQICRERGYIRERGKQRTDSTHVLAAIRTMNRLECVGETLRAALNSLAAVVPDWVRAFVPVEWYERYGDRIEDYRMPKEASKRQALAEQIGADGYCSQRSPPVRLQPGSGKSQQSRCCGGSGYNSLPSCKSRWCGAPMTTSLQHLG